MYRIYVDMEPKATRGIIKLSKRVGKKEIHGFLTGETNRMGIFYPESYTSIGKVCCKKDLEVNTQTLKDKFGFGDPNV